MSLRALLRPRAPLSAASGASPARNSRCAASAGEPDERPASGTLIPAVPLAELLEPHRAMLERLRIAYGGEEGSFEARLLPLIRRYAAFVHLLPATADAHFGESGGLLRLGLEVGLHAVQVADGQLFAARGTVTERRAFAPRWRTAAFLAGMCAEIHRAVAEVAVIADDGARWLPVTGPLTDWLAAGGRTGYVVQPLRSPEPLEAAALVALPYIVDADLACFLEASRPCLVTEVIAALSGEPVSGSRPLGAILRQTLARTVDRDLRDRRPASTPHAVPAVAPASTARDSGPANALPTAAAAEVDLPSAPQPPETDPRDRPASVAVELPRRAGEATPPDPTASIASHGRPLVLPATLNPVVAEALSALIEDPRGTGRVDTPRGIFMPLAAFARAGLDTGLVVRVLHDAGLLVTDRGRKVRTLGDGPSGEPGIVLAARTLAAQASLPFGR